MKDPYEILVKPVITEKATNLQTRREPQYTFRVHIDSNKREIKQAVEKAFNVHVADVNTIRLKGKLKRVPRVGRTTNWKKAIVTLREGESIELY